jgi:hypothetical protein
MLIPYKLYLTDLGRANPLLAVVIGAVVGALAVWTLTFSGLPVEGWMAALLVTCFAVAGGVSGMGLPTGHNEKSGPAIG